MGIYENYLNADYKKDILDMIKIDVQKELKDMKEEELNHFCNNVFTVAVLTANKVEDQDIADEIMNLNRNFINECEKNGIEIKETVSQEQMELSSALSEKYIKVITDINNKVV